MRTWHRPLDLLEAAYRLDGTDAEWMDNLVDTAYRVFAAEKTGAGGFVVLGKVDDCGRTIYSEAQTVSVRGRGMRYPVQPFLQAHKKLSAELQQRLFFGGSAADTLSNRSGYGPRLCTDRFWIEYSGWDASVAQDALELLGHDSALSSVVLAVPLSAPATLTATERTLGERVAAHVGSAFRLRRQRLVSANTAQAVLSRSGRIEHLLDPSDGPTVGDAFARREHARDAVASTEEALVVWQGLHDGRWSLVDYVDSDGKAFVLAVENAPKADFLCALSDRQRAALSLAALGYGNEQIAYALGVSQAAVAMSLRRARQTTGFRSRAELVRAFKLQLARRE
jgi:DNA-binding CsgD family transcriptional regulator